MSIERDFNKYHKSISQELAATKDRVRYLIGGAHFPTDGQLKETVLRKVLRNHIAETLHIGTGFVCGPEKSSHQLDILITARNKPTLFKDGELLFVTPDAVLAIIEVKTSMPTDIVGVLDKLADDVSMIRGNGSLECKAGLFIYNASGKGYYQSLLKNLQEVSRGDINRVINWITAGPDLFIRFWQNGNDENSTIKEEVWHSYYLENLSHAYFMSNVVWDTCPHLDFNMQYAWFPIEGGKVNYRKWYAPLGSGCPNKFAEACIIKEGTPENEE